MAYSELFQAEVRLSPAGVQIGVHLVDSLTFGAALTFLIQLRETSPCWALRSIERQFGTSLSQELVPLIDAAGAEGVDRAIGS